MLSAFVYLTIDIDFAYFWFVFSTVHQLNSALRATTNLIVFTTKLVTIMLNEGLAMSQNL